MICFWVITALKGIPIGKEPTGYYMPFEKKRLKSLAYIQYEIVDLYEIGYLFSILVFGLLNSYDI